MSKQHDEENELLIDNSPLPLTRAEKFIDGMNSLELAVHNFAPVRLTYNTIDWLRLNLQTNPLLKPRLLTDQQREATPLSIKKPSTLAARMGAYTKAMLTTLNGPKFIADTLIYRTRQVIGVAITLAVQVVNIPVKTVATAWHLIKLAAIKSGMNKENKSKICDQDHFNETVTDLKETSRDLGISILVGGVTVIGFLSGGIVPAITVGMASTLAAMHLTATMAADIGFAKKALFTVGEEGKKDPDVLKQRNPELYKKLTEARTVIDDPLKPIKERKAAAIVEKELLQEFRDKQNRMITMPYRAAKKVITGEEPEFEAAKNSLDKLTENKMSDLDHAHKESLGVIHKLHDNLPKDERSKAHARMEELRMVRQYEKKSFSREF